MPGISNILTAEQRFQEGEEGAQDAEMAKNAKAAEVRRLWKKKNAKVGSWLGAAASLKA
jgi:hypothetical protein